MTFLAFNVNQSMGFVPNQSTEIQELTFEEIEEVNGAGPGEAGAAGGFIGGAWGARALRGASWGARLGAFAGPLGFVAGGIGGAAVSVGFFMAAEAAYD